VHHSSPHRYIHTPTGPLPTPIPHSLFHTVSGWRCVTSPSGTAHSVSYSVTVLRLATAYTMRYGNEMMGLMVLCECECGCGCGCEWWGREWKSCACEWERTAAVVVGGVSERKCRLQENFVSPSYRSAVARRQPVSM
jgi:hypothetical protein